MIRMNVISPIVAHFGSVLRRRNDKTGSDAKEKRYKITHAISAQLPSAKRTPLNEKKVPRIETLSVATNNNRKIPRRFTSPRLFRPSPFMKSIPSICNFEFEISNAPGAVGN
jgi:hypothetical protein